MEALHDYVQRLAVASSSIDLRNAASTGSLDMSIKPHKSGKGTVYEVRFRGPDGCEFSQRFRTKAER